MNLIIKIADQKEELEQLFALNHETFAEEIPQHTPNESRLLIDRFHENNLYAIALYGETIVGMLSLNGKRPFSLDSKIPNLDEYLPPYSKICEIRLLAVNKKHRGGKIFFRLLSFMKDHAKGQGYDMAVISGFTKQKSLYESIGFKKFAYLTGVEPATFHPMYITVSDIERFFTRTTL